MTEPPRANLEVPIPAGRAERGSAVPADSTAGSSESPSPSRLSLASLLGLSRELADLLVSVQPSAEWRAELYRHLVAEARRQQAMRVLSVHANGGGGLADGTGFSLRDSHRMMRQVLVDAELPNRRWIIGAAAVGSASLLGFLVFVRRRRQGKAA